MSVYEHVSEQREMINLFIKKNSLVFESLRSFLDPQLVLAKFKHATEALRCRLYIHTVNINFTSSMIILSFGL